MARFLKTNNKWINVDLITNTFVTEDDPVYKSKKALKVYFGTETYIVCTDGEAEDMTACLESMRVTPETKIDDVARLMSMDKELVLEYLRERNHDVGNLKLLRTAIKILEEIL